MHAVWLLVNSTIIELQPPNIRNLKKSRSPDHHKNTTELPLSFASRWNGARLSTDAAVPTKQEVLAGLSGIGGPARKITCPRLLVMKAVHTTTLTDTSAAGMLSEMPS